MQLGWSQKITDNERHKTAAKKKLTSGSMLASKLFHITGPATAKLRVPRTVLVQNSNDIVRNSVTEHISYSYRILI